MHAGIASGRHDRSADEEHGGGPERRARIDVIRQVKLIKNARKSSGGKLEADAERHSPHPRKAGQNREKNPEVDGPQQALCLFSCDIQHRVIAPSRRFR